MTAKIFALALLSLIIKTNLQAQDFLYSQFYNSPIYLNPALNGQFEGDLRMSLIYRSQWTNLPGPLNYYTFSIDANLPKLNGGLGFMLTNSSEGTAYLNKLNMAGIYSYSVEFENSVLSFGLQAGLTNLKIDFDKLVFLDQLNAQGIIPGAASSAVSPVTNNKLFFDAGTGVNYVIGDFMIGSSIQHLNNPNESLTGITTLLPVRLNAYASYKYKLTDFDDSPSVIPSVVVEDQAKVSSYSVGMQYKNKGVNVGLWYRSTGQQGDAIVVSVIFDLFPQNDKFRFGISHDATTSSLGYSNTAGSTEAALVYITGYSDHYNNYQNGKNYGNRCYDFY